MKSYPFALVFRLGVQEQEPHTTCFMGEHCTEKDQVWIDSLGVDSRDQKASYRNYQTGRTGDATRFHWNNLDVEAGSLILKYHRTDQERGVKIAWIKFREFR